MSGLQASAPGVYQRHRPETTALYEVVKDNLDKSGTTATWNGHFPKTV